MHNYFRITAYHPAEDISAVFDSNGLYEKLWQFSSALLQKGFKVLEVGNDEKFLDGAIPKAEPSDKLILRACGKGQPVCTTLAVDGTSYKAVSVEGKTYVPDKAQTV